MSHDRQPSDFLIALRKAATVLLLLFTFLVGIKGLGSGFKMLCEDFLGAFFAATENPLVGLMVGILGTTLVQSSSVTTSMVVGLVSSGTLSVANGIPMIMGANIGTSVTNLLVSTGHMSRKQEFEKAFSAAIIHDLFNIMAVFILLPIEMATGFLQRISTFASGLIYGGAGISFKSPVKLLIGPPAEAIKEH